MVTEEGSGMAMGGSSWVWAFLIFALLIGGGGLFGNNRNNAPQDLSASGLATKDDLANQFNFSALERQNNEIVSEVRNGTNETVSAMKDGVMSLTSTVKDSAYNNLSELRDLQTTVNGGFSNMQSCCCSIERSIDSVNYNNALNTSNINATTTAQTQKILDAISQSKIESLQGQISQLQLQNAMNGVVKYPSAFTYSTGNPFCGCGCGQYYS